MWVKWWQYFVLGHDVAFDAVAVEEDVLLFLDGVYVVAAAAVGDDAVVAAAAGVDDAVAAVVVDVAADVGVYVALFVGSVEFV